MSSPAISPNDSHPLAVTAKRAAELSGLGLTSIWAFLRDGRLDAVRVPGVRRTLVSYSSLARLLSPPSTLAPAPRKRGRPPKQQAQGTTA
jgi:hypothetical protein